MSGRRVITGTVRAPAGATGEDTHSRPRAAGGLCDSIHGLAVALAKTRDNVFAVPFCDPLSRDDSCG